MVGYSALAPGSDLRPCARARLGVQAVSLARPTCYTAPMRIQSTLSLVLLAFPLATACTPKSRYVEKTGKVVCDKAKECGTLEFLFGDYDSCINLVEDGAQETLDKCDKYNGSLAYQCLQDVKKASCDDDSSSDACDKFDEKCGFDNQTAIVEYENGVSVYGLVDYRFDE